MSKGLLTQLAECRAGLCLGLSWLFLGHVCIANPNRGIGEGLRVLSGQSGISEPAVISVVRGFPCTPLNSASHHFPDSPTTRRCLGNVFAASS